MTDEITVPGLPAVEPADVSDLLPASRAGLAKRVSVRQILDLIARGDLAEKLFAEDMAFDPGEGPLAAENVQAAIDEVQAALEALAVPPAIPAWQVVQEVYVERSTADTTTSATFTDTGLTANITPLYADSLIVAEAFIPSALVSRVAGDLAPRVGIFRLRNSTAAINGPTSTIGRNLSASSTVGSAIYQPTSVRYRAPVSSLVLQAFVLQFSVSIATNLQLSTDAATAPISLLLKEIKQ